MNNLVHHINEFNLCQAFRQLDGAKAVEVDQVTKKEYGNNLQTNIEDLFDEIYRGGWRPKPARQVMIPKPAAFCTDSRINFATELRNKRTKTEGASYVEQKVPFRNTKSETLVFRSCLK